tara:strand:+ start:477 stop:728 length:252 start_codon:yes stop_codon:yes gene_type:complete
VAALKPRLKEGWIKDPNTQSIIRFHRDPDSWSKHPDVFLDKGWLMPYGYPPLLKDRRHLAMTEAVELWEQLLQDGWERVAPQW